MYLLKPRTNVAVNPTNENLHSTMYLLKPESIDNRELLIEFTFHHVSIKTICYNDLLRTNLIFTFHHVSIKTAL